MNKVLYKSQQIVIIQSCLTCFRTEKHNAKKENVIINNPQPKQNYLYQDTYFYQYAKCQRNGFFLLDTTPPTPT